MAKWKRLMDKTVDKFRCGKYVACDGFSAHTAFEEVVKIYKKKIFQYDKIVIRQWEDGREIKEEVLTN